MTAAQGDLFAFVLVTDPINVLLVNDGVGIRPCSILETTLYELLRKIESASTGTTGIPDKDKLVGIVQEIRKVIGK